jgi:hypothetical protein
LLPSSTPHQVPKPSRLRERPSARVINQGVRASLTGTPLVPRRSEDVAAYVYIPYQHARTHMALLQKNLAWPVGRKVKTARDRSLRPPAVGTPPPTTTTEVARRTHAVARPRPEPTSIYSQARPPSSAAGWNWGNASLPRLIYRLACPHANPAAPSVPIAAAGPAPPANSVGSHGTPLPRPRPPGAPKFPTRPDDSAETCPHIQIHAASRPPPHPHCLGGVEDLCTVQAQRRLDRGGRPTDASCRGPTERHEGRRARGGAGAAAAGVQRQPRPGAREVLPLRRYVRSSPPNPLAAPCPCLLPAGCCCSSLLRREHQSTVGSGSAIPGSWINRADTLRALPCCLRACS